MRIFVTHIVPLNKVMEYKLSMAACNFSYNLINGGTFDKVYSILPTFIKGNMNPFDGLIYSLWRKNKILYRFAPIWENIKLFYRIPANASIWYYNVTFLNALLIILIKIFRPKVKQQIIILDYTPSEKKIDRFYLWLVNHVDGTIRLAESKLFTCSNSVCLPGVVPINSPIYPLITKVSKEFLISGALGENISMLSMLLSAFSQMPDMILHITGRAPNINLVKKYTDRYNNIIYHGMVTYDEYLNILHNVPFLLSTRNPNFPENQCNFPSKIIEALLHNRIIISTLYYSQLAEIRYFKVSSIEKDFILDIQHIADMSQNELLYYSNQSDITKNLFSVEVWKDWMSKIERYEKNV